MMEDGTFGSFESDASTASGRHRAPIGGARTAANTFVVLMVGAALLLCGVLVRDNLNLSGSGSRQAPSMSRFTVGSRHTLSAAKPSLASFDVAGGGADLGAGVLSRLLKLRTVEAEKHTTEMAELMEHHEALAARQRQHLRIAEADVEQLKKDKADLERQLKKQLGRVARLKVEVKELKAREEMADEKAAENEEKEKEQR